MFAKYTPRILLAAILLMVAGSVMAEVNLRWDFGDTLTIGPGETSRLAVLIDDAINFRTIEVTVEYDTTIVRSLGGGTGSLFTDSGFFIFDGFEEEPGSWHGFAIVMGAGDFVTGPGELLFWEIEGLANGSSPIISIEILLYDEASPPVIIPDVFLDDGTIIVYDPLSATSETPPAKRTMKVAPNPFNPRTRVSFDLEQDSHARLTVFDMRGRQIAQLYDGPAGEMLTVDWDGTDTAGRSQPGGVYFFQLETNTGIARCKGLLVK